MRAAWAFTQLNAPLGAFYALAAALTFAALPAGIAPMMREKWLAASTPIARETPARPTPPLDKALLIAVNLARSGVSRDVTEHVLRETLAISDTAAILDDTYAPSQSLRSGE